MSMTSDTVTQRPAAPADAGAVVPASESPGHLVAADPTWGESRIPSGPRPADPLLSPRTGEPRRPAVLAVACALFALATLFYAFATFATFWGIVHHARSSTLLIRANRPAEASIPLVLLAVLAVVHVASVAAACAYAGFQAWNGWLRARFVALGAIVAAGLLFTVNLLPLWGLAALVPAAVLLWLPRITLYNRHQSTFRYVRANPVSRAPLPATVPYGPLAKYRHVSH